MQLLNFVGLSDLSNYNSEFLIHNVYIFVCILYSDCAMSSDGWVLSSCGAINKEINNI